jgi:hypothetical protein
MYWIMIVDSRDEPALARAVDVVVLVLLVKQERRCNSVVLREEEECSECFTETSGQMIGSTSLFHCILAVHNTNIDFLH